jgi:sterol desaturase/sphingolipid hydroxylase (fatty acid hydroxylase superfamily)
VTQTRIDLKQSLLNLMPPATVAAIVLFWSLAPAAWVKSPWSISLVIVFTLAFVLGLEWISERHAGWRLTWREFLTDAFYVALGFTVIDWLSSHLAEDPLKAVKQTLHIATPWIGHLPFLVQVALVIFLVEFGQYWMHRLMHNVYPLWLTHAPHHHITQLNAMKGSVGNPIELFLISLSVIALLDFDLVAVLCAGSVGSAISVYAHANVRSDPPRWYAFFFTTIQHHSLHHSVRYEDTLCNYANSLILIDRVFGTFKAGEAEIVGQDERKRLSIREQFLFPFVPVIAMIRARQGRSATT